MGADIINIFGDIAEKGYQSTLIESRTDINMTHNELKSITDIIVPLIKFDNTPYQVATNHPELNITE